VKWSQEVTERFPELAVCLGLIKGVTVERTNSQIEELKSKITNEVKRSHRIEELRDNPIVRAYRNFYWKLDIDPTKTRPSGEALLRRILRGKTLPTISTVVDAYNLASLKTIIPLSGFDLKLLNPPLEVRFSKENEEFQGIGMATPIKLKNNMLVLADKTGILCVYPYKDADATKITLSTKKVVIIGYGAPGIAENKLKNAVETTIRFIKQVSGGKTEIIKIFKP
jgi:DNA/RNA-binding domain of Phe-tRNA-synthetase-like protein